MKILYPTSWCASHAESTIATSRGHPALDSMAVYDDYVGLETFTLRAQCVSQHLAAIIVEQRDSSGNSSCEDSPAQEPMQTDAYRLSTDERQSRLQQGLCLYCSKPDHSLQTCPVHPPCPAVSMIHLSLVVSNPQYHDATVIYGSHSYSVTCHMSWHVT